MESNQIYLTKKQKVIGSIIIYLLLAIIVYFFVEPKTIILVLYLLGIGVGIHLVMNIIPEAIDRYYTNKKKERGLSAEEAWRNYIMDKDIEEYEKDPEAWRKRMLKEINDAEKKG